MAHRVPTRAKPARLDLWLWLVAVLFFGVGDAATTGFGLTIEGVAEHSPTVGPHLHEYGFQALIAMKSALLLGGFILWRAVPRPHAVGVPLGLAFVGVVVTGWNMGVLVVASAV